MIHTLDNDEIGETCSKLGFITQPTLSFFKARSKARSTQEGGRLLGLQGPSSPVQAHGNQPSIKCK